MSVRSRTALAGPVLAAAALRLWRLDAQGLWNDEIDSLRIAAGSLADTVVHAGHDVHPPGYFLLLDLWTRVAGTGDVAARIPSAAADTLTVALLGVLGRRLVGPRAGLLAAWGWALGLLPLYYAREARPYALAALLAVAATLALLRLGRQRGPLPVVLWAAAAAGLTYVHYFGGLVLAAHAAWTARLALRDAAGRRVALRAGVGALLAAAAFGPWVPRVLDQLRGIREGFWVPPLTAEVVLRTPGALLSLLRPPWAVTPPPAPVAAAFLVLCGLLGALALTVPAVRRWLAAPAGPVRPLPGAGWLLGLWLGLPPLLGALAGLAGVRIYTFRNLIVCAPALVLLAAGLLARAGRRPAVFALAAAALLAPSLGSYGWLWGTPHKEPWREAAVQVAAAMAPGDRFLFHPAWVDKNLRHYLDVAPQSIVAPEEAPWPGVRRLWFVAGRYEVTGEEERIRLLLLRSGFQPAGAAGVDPRFAVTLWRRVAGGAEPAYR